MEQEAGPGEPVRLENQMAVMLRMRVANVKFSSPKAKVS